MARNERRIDWSYFLDARNFVKGNKDAQRSLSTTEKAMGTLKKAFGAVAIAFGAREVVQWAGDAIQLAVAADEVDSRFKAVFGTAGDLTDQLREWGDVAGVTETGAKDLASSFGNLAQVQGLTNEQSQEMALNVAKLAGDLASFQDKDPAAVFRALNKGLLTTEREGLKEYNLALTQAEVTQRALAIAVQDGRSEATKADMAYASYAIAVEQAGQANGDLERTADSTASQQRQLKATIMELQEEIGRELLPVFADLLEVASDLTPVMKGAAKAVGAAVEPFSKLSSATADLTDNQAGLPGLVGALAGVAESAVNLIAPSNLVGDALRDMGDDARASAEGVKEITSESPAAGDAAYAMYRQFARGMLDAGYAGGVGAAGVNELNAALAANIDFLGRLDSALSGDLFRRYKQFADTGRFNDNGALEALGAGGRGNADYDRGEDYTNAQTVYNGANGIS